jgi:hypothetical protein
MPKESEMKKFLMFLLCLLPFAASADFIARCDPPSTKTADRAASITAAAVVKHLINVDYLTCLENGGTCRKPARRDFLPQFSKADSIGIIGGHTRMCFQFFKAGSTTQCDYSIPAQSEPFPAPAVCVWNKLSSANQAKVRDLGVGP